MWLVEDVKDVYPGVIFDGNGSVKKNPIHVIVPKLLPIKMDVLQFEPSGLQGLLEMFFVNLSFTILEAVILGSTDQETLNTTTIMIKI